MRVVALVLVVVAGVVGVGASASGGETLSRSAQGGQTRSGTFPTYGFRTSPVGTWTDGAGRTQAAWATEYDLSTGLPAELLVARLTFAGQPDAAWGTDPRTGAEGVRRTALSRPTWDGPDGGHVEGQLQTSAVDPDGQITLFWYISHPSGPDLFDTTTYWRVDRLSPSGSLLGSREIGRYVRPDTAGPGFTSNDYGIDAAPLEDGSIAVTQSTYSDLTELSTRA